MLVIILPERANLGDILILKLYSDKAFMIEKEVDQGDSYELKNDDFFKIFNLTLNERI